MRLFVSIKPPEETLAYLELCIADLANANKRMTIKWSDRSLLHLTVLFLGEIEDELVPKIQGVLAETCNPMQRFFVDLSAPELLFKNDRPNLVVMKVFDQSGILNELYSNLYEKLKHDITLDKKKFMPHITLGRVKTTLRFKKKINVKTGHIDSVFPVNEIQLVESKLTPIGPLYTTIETYSVNHA